MLKTFQLSLAWAISIPMIRTLAKVTVLSGLFQHLPLKSPCLCITIFAESRTPFQDVIRKVPSDKPYPHMSTNMVYLSKQVHIMHAFYKNYWKSAPQNRHF